MSALVHLPANLPNIAHAKLPQVYEQAKVALADCYRIDECKTWADKAEAIASYAKQADDTTLRAFADRIQARAVRRCGELLRDFESAGGRPQKTLHGAVDSFPKSQKEAAEQAGLSKRQRDTAVAVAKVPQPEFDEAVESKNPPTVTALADRGKQKRPEPLVNLGGRDPKDFAAATAAQGSIERLSQMAETHDVKAIVRGISRHEIQPMLASLEVALRWLSDLKTELEGM